MNENLDEFKFDSSNELMKFINSIINNISPQELLEFIDNLDPTMLKKLVKNPKKSNRINFLEVILQDLGDYETWRDPDHLDFIKEIFKRIGAEYFNHLMNFVVIDDGFINLPVLEALIYIDSKKMKDFLSHTRHKFKFGFRNDILWDFQLILNIILSCFNPEELMTYLEENHKDDLFKLILPKMYGFKFLKMSDQKEIDMKHFITAFLLEEAGSENYTENLKKMGPFLADIIFSEIIDKHGEINETVIRILDYLRLQINEELLTYLKRDISDLDLYLNGNSHNFIKFVEFTLKYLGKKELIMKLSTYQYVDTILYPDLKEEIYPLNEIIDSVIDGLSSSDPQFYEATKVLITSILSQFQELLTHTFGVSTDDYFIDSILYFLYHVYNSGGKEIIIESFANLSPSLREDCKKNLLEF